MASLCDIYAPAAKTGDYKKVASQIMASEAPGQPILVFTADAALPLAYYYTGPNLLVPLPQEEDCQTFDLQRYVLKDERDVVKALSRVPGDYEFVWLVTTTAPGKCSYLDVDFNCQILEAFVTNRYSIELDKRFYGSRVRFLHRLAEP